MQQEYQFIGDTPQAILGDTLWQPGETRPVTDEQAVELAKNANWKVAPQETPAAPSSAAEETPSDVTPTLAAQAETTPAPVAAPPPTQQEAPPAEQPPLGG